MTMSTTPGGAGESPDPTLARLDAIDRRLDRLEWYLGLGAAHPAMPAPPVPAVEPAAAPAAEPDSPRAPAPPSPGQAWLAGVMGPEELAEPAVAPMPAPPVEAATPAPARPWPPAPVGRERVVSHPQVSEPAVSQPTTPFSFRELEARLTGRALAWAGGLALIIGVVFLLSLAFSRGWITPEMRVALGLVGGAIAIAVAAWCFERAQPMLGHVLSAVGLGAISLALFAATRLFGLVDPEVALAGSFLCAVIAAGMAIRYDTQVVAAFGLVAVLAAPPVLGASGNLVTMAFLGTALVGTTIIALFRSWPWLPRLAFLLAAPQVLWWVSGDPQPGVSLGIAVLAGFWALNAAAATGTELPPTRTAIGPPSAALLVLNALFAVGAGALLIRDQAIDLAGTLLALLGLAHLLLAGYLFRRRGDHHPFGLLAAGLGLTAVVVAVPVEYEGARVALLWTALAVGLVVPYGHRRHEVAAAAALIVAGLAVLHLGLVEYPWRAWNLAGTQVDHLPFVSEGGAALGGLLLGALAAGRLVRDLRVRCALAVAAALLVAYALPYEMAELPLVAAWLALGLALLAGQRLLEGHLGPPDTSSPEPAVFEAQPARWLAVPAVVAVALGVAHLLVLQLPPGALPALQLPATPFVDERTVYAAVVVAALLSAAAITTEALLRAIALIVATATTAYLFAFEVGPTATVVLWCGLAALQVVAIRLDAGGKLAYLATAAVLVGVAISRTLLATSTGTSAPPPIAPPDRLVVTAAGIEPHVFLVSEATLALGAIAAVLAAGAWYLRAYASIALGLRGAAMATVAYLVTVGIVDEFAGRVGGPVPVEELVLQAQTACVVAWCFLAAAQALAVRFDPPGWLAYASTAAVLTGLAAAQTIVTLARPGRLVVTAEGIDPHPFLVSEATLTLGAIAAVLAGAAWLLRASPLAPWLRVAAGVVVVYLLSVAVVDEFAGRVGGTVALEELQRQAQVALSILWAAIGFGTFAVGAVRGHALAREFGLALLAIATVKVFVFDLSFLDVAYRVLSFIGLGLLLLAGAFVYQSHRPRPGGQGRPT